MADEQHRRHGPDLVVRSIKVLAVIAWLVMGGVFILLTRAKPRVRMFIESQYDIMMSSNWDQTLMQYNFYLLVFLLALCLIGLVLNRRRHRRKRDSYNSSLVLFTVLAMLGLVFYLLAFIL